FSISFVLSRVLHSGVIMSIEKNDHELKGLGKSIAKITGKTYVSLFNTFTGAIHGALWGQDLAYHSSARIEYPTEQERKFAHWLGIQLVSDPHLEPAYATISINWENLGRLNELVHEA